MLDLIFKYRQCYIDGKLNDVVFKDDKIHIIDEISEEAKEIVNAEDKTVLAGCIDAQIHFREPRSNKIGDLKYGSRAAIAGNIKIHDVKILV